MQMQSRVWRDLTGYCTCAVHYCQCTANAVPSTPLHMAQTTHRCDLFLIVLVLGATRVRVYTFFHFLAVQLPINLSTQWPFSFAKMFVQNLSESRISSIISTILKIVVSAFRLCF